MPTAPLRPCAKCHRVLVRAGRCAACQPVRAALSARGWYHTRRWRQLRALILGRSPLCVVCHGAATTVDHLVPHGMSPDLFWDEANLQTLCTSCHSRKTAVQDGGFGHRKG